MRQSEDEVQKRDKQKKNKAPNKDDKVQDGEERGLEWDADVDAAEDDDNKVA